MYIFEEGNGKIEWIDEFQTIGIVEKDNYPDPYYRYRDEECECYTKESCDLETMFKCEIKEMLELMQYNE